MTCFVNGCDQECAYTFDIYWETNLGKISFTVSACVNCFLRILDQDRYEGASVSSFLDYKTGEPAFSWEEG
jgi:hypothetical protein